MLRLRPYKPCDAEKIVSWCGDEPIFLKWGGSLIGEFPLSAEQLNEVYINQNGLCKEADNFYPMVAFDENGVVGSFIMRYINGDKKCLRFGWVIVDDKMRGRGYGKEMLKLGLQYAFDILKVDEVTLGVYHNNPGAEHCYRSLGFVDNPKMENTVKVINGEEWIVKELVVTRDAEKKSELQVRKATKDDVNQIFAFVQKAVARMIEQGIPQWDEIYPTVDDFAEDAEKNQLYVAEIDGKPAACFTLSQECDDAYADGDWSYGGPDFLVIHRLCVNPEFQNQGVGTKVCLEIEKIALAAGMKSLKLDCFTLNPYSQKMYNKLGYKTVGFADWRKGRFILMEKLL